MAVSMSGRTQGTYDSIEEHVARDDEAKAAGRRQEREIIVGWLRSFGVIVLGALPGSQCAAVDALADAVERCEHHR